MLREFRRGSSSGTGHDEALAKLGGAVPPRQADLRDPIVLKALCALLRSDWISGINLDVSDDPWSSEKAAPSAAHNPWRRKRAATGAPGSILESHYRTQRKDIDCPPAETVALALIMIGGFRHDK